MDDAARREGCRSHSRLDEFPARQFVRHAHMLPQACQAALSAWVR